MCRKSLILWSGRQDSNLRPPAPKAGALTRLRYAPTKRYAWKKAEAKVDTLIPGFPYKRNPFFNFHLTTIFHCAIKIACNAA